MAICNNKRSVQVIKYTCGAGTPEEAETNCTYFIRGECTASFCEYRRKKQTNADRIRAMSDEELVEFIKNIKVRAALCKAVKDNDAFEALCSAEWLQQPAKEDKHETD